MNKVLIIACSQRKRPDAGLLPALDRYDGPAFQVLRRFLRECPEAHLDVQGLVKAAVAEATREDVLPDWNDVV